MRECNDVNALMSMETQKSGLFFCECSVRLKRLWSSVLWPDTSHVKSQPKKFHIPSLFISNKRWPCI